MSLNPPRLRFLSAATLICILQSAAAQDARQPLDVGPADAFNSAPRFDVSMQSLWKRRRGGSHSDSDSSSDSSSSPGSDDDDEVESDSSSDSPKCWVTKNITRQAHSDGYRSFYPVGNGSPSSTEGGYTQKGSGAPPVWDNSTGRWVKRSYHEVSYLDDQEYLSYFGGASVPYPVGNPSPNGMHPVRLDLDFVAAPYPYFGNELCTVPNPSYAYKYQAGLNWTEETDGESVTRFVPVYCCCALFGLCGCDDFHLNSSFVPALLDYLLLGMQYPMNQTSVCSVDFGGTALIVNGTVQNGSTKADAGAEPIMETVSTTTLQYCQPTDSGYPSGADGRAEFAPSQQAFVIAWVATIMVGGLFGTSLVLL